MNIRIYDKGGKGAIKASEKSTEKATRSVNEMMKEMDQYLERAKQMQKGFTTGTRTSTPRFTENISSSSSKLISKPKQKGVTPVNIGTLEGPRLVPKGKSIGQRIFSKLKNNKVSNFIRNHSTLATIGAGAGLGLWQYNANSENPENTDTTTSQEQVDSPGFVIGEDGTPYYYNGSGYTNDFIQDSDGNIYSSQGELLGNVGNDARLAGYDDIFDYNAVKAGVDPSQVADIQQLLGINPDGKWGVITQAAYQNALKQIQNNKSGIPYTIYNSIQQH